MPLRLSALPHRRQQHGPDMRVDLVRVDLEAATACIIDRMTASARCLSNAAVSLTGNRGRLAPMHEPASRDWCSWGELYSAPKPLTDEASKVGALPQTPPGAEPLDLNTYARFR